MATIKSGYGTDYMAVDPNRAARVTIYDTAGSNRYPAYVGGYQCRVDFVPASILADGTTYWAMRNTGSSQVYLRSVNLTSSFATLTGVASRSLFKIERFNTGTPTGGSAIPIVKRDNSYPNSSIATAMFANSGLTSTSVVFEGNSPMVFGVVNSPGAISNNVFDFAGGGEEGRFVLASGEGLAIRANGAVVAGCAVQGSIWWDER